ncbi:hypothetical protein HQK17_28030 [Bacillus cereus]|uniref:hypothetical protein n=1 Tax=Bacillus cereus TaxID=1396 RepID=UPI00156BBFDA|nr:hypothetical protein [Bacillus cereus]NRQ71971.1 hypothetical protein [Bacillus cereus]
MKTIEFAQKDKKVYEILAEIKRQDFSLSGAMCMLLRTGVRNITSSQADTICTYAGRGQEEQANVFEALRKDVEIKLLPEPPKELTLAEAMERMNAKREPVKMVTRSGKERIIRRYTDFEDLTEYGIRDFDDLNDAKFFEVE